MQPEESLALFFSLCAGADAPALSAAGWDEFVEFCRARGTAPYLYARRAPAKSQSLRGLPTATASRLEQLYLANVALSMAAASQLAEILKCLNELDIPAIPLKGAYLSLRLYKDAAERTMGDLDVLVREADIPATLQAMQRLGYQASQPAWETPGHHLPPMRKPGKFFALEVHWRLVSPARLESIDPARLWEAARPITLAGSPCFELSPTHSLFHVCQHTANHLFSNALKAICDIDILIRGFSDELDWTEFGSLVHSINGAIGVLLALQLAHQFLDTPLPGSVLQMLAERPLPAPILESAISGMATGAELADSPPEGALKALRWWFGKAQKILRETRLGPAKPGDSARFSTAKNSANRLRYVLAVNLDAISRLRRRGKADEKLKKQQRLRNWLGMR